MVHGVLKHAAVHVRSNAKQLSVCRMQAARSYLLLYPEARTGVEHVRFLLELCQQNRHTWYTDIQYDTRYIGYDNDILHQVYFVKKRRRIS